MSYSSIMHWSSLSLSKSEVLNVSGHVAPSEGFMQTQVSTLAVKDKLLVAGGFQGEHICKMILLTGMQHLGWPRAKTTYDDNAITNAVEIYATPKCGAVHFITLNNDCGVRDFDMEKFHLSTTSTCLGQ